MTTVCYVSSFVPPELIAACGCRPRRVVPTLPEDRPLGAEGRCPYAQAWLQTALETARRETESLFISVTTCDQMRRISELMPPRTFLLNLPSTRTDFSFRYFCRELIRLKTFLCTEAQTSFDATRLGHRIEPSPIAEQTEPRQLRVALLGGPLPPPLRNALHALMKPFDAAIVLDAAEDRLPDTDAQLSANAFTRLARRCFQIPTVRQRPNHDLYAWFADRLQHAQADGVLLLRYLSCDLWHAAAWELKNQLTIPCLEIDLDGGSALPASAESRIQAFLETLSR